MQASTLASVLDSGSTQMFGISFDLSTPSPKTNKDQKLNISTDNAIREHNMEGNANTTGFHGGLKNDSKVVDLLPINGKDAENVLSPEDTISILYGPPVDSTTVH